MKIIEQGILPLFYHNEIETCIELTKTLYSAGIRAIEFTNRGEQALKNFTELVKIRNQSMPDLLLAVGTIKSPSQAHDFIEAGADVLISPIFDEEIMAFTRDKILWIPGCMTPTEIHFAEKSGCKIIKIFPGNVLGIGFTEAIKPLFPTLKFLVTGGVDTTHENLSAWFKAGIVAVGLGSKLITNDIIANKKYEQLRQKTVEILNNIDHIRNL
jgi:2-dehydro-3-deoxyphosphogluconate aldolase/(4S)-4-hydroxy-2-oxoglutarate aldolase